MSESELPAATEDLRRYLKYVIERRGETQYQKENYALWEKFFDAKKTDNSVALLNWLASLRAGSDSFCKDETCTRVEEHNTERIREECWNSRRGNSRLMVEPKSAGAIGTGTAAGAAAAAAAAKTGKGRRSSLLKSPQSARSTAGSEGLQTNSTGRSKSRRTSVTWGSSEGSPALKVSRGECGGDTASEQRAHVRRVGCPSPR